jgi:hypothetical protein
MSRTISVLTTHGIGSPSPDYAAKAMRRLGVALAKKDITLQYRSVHYDPIIERAASVFAKDQIARGMDDQPATRAAIHMLADALVGGSNARMQARIFDLIDTEYCKLRSSEVVLVGHSLGCKLLLDWLSSRRSATVSTLVTMACNSALWYLDPDDPSGVSMPVPAQLQSGGKWLNLADKDDMLGAMMEGASHGRAIDVEVKVGGWLTGRWGTSHTKYWGSDSIFSRTLPGLLAL